MRRLTTYATLMIFSAITGFGATLTGASYQTSCTAAGTLAVAGSSSCFSGPGGLSTASMQPQFGVSYASASAIITSSFGGSGYSDVHAVETTRLGVAYATNNSSYLPAVSATSDAQFGAYLTTAGPVREGLLQIIFTDTSMGSPSNATASGTFSMSLPGAQSLTCGISWQPCAATATVSHFDSLGGFIVPLGTSFYLNYNGIFQALAGGYTDGNGSGTLDLDYQFRFVEADGITPVAVLSAAPEPANLCVLGFALVSVALAYKRRSAQPSAR